MAKQAPEPTYIDPWTEAQAHSCTFPVWIEGREIWSVEQYKAIIAEKKAAPALKLDQKKQ